MLTITGILRNTTDDRVRRVTWDNGKLDGDATACASLRAESIVRRGSRLGPTMGPYTYRNHLRSARSVLTLADAVFATILTVHTTEPSSVANDTDI